MNFGQNDSDKIIEEIKKMGHFEIKFEPVTEKNLSTKELLDIIQENRLTHEGMPYPRIPNNRSEQIKTIENGIEFIFKRDIEMDNWKFYKTGKFEQYKSFVEGLLDDDDHSFYRQSRLEKAPIDKIPHFDLTLKTCEITEIFLFVIKLANKFKCKFNMKIKLNNMKNKDLTICSWSRFGLIDNYICEESFIPPWPIRIHVNASQTQYDKCIRNIMLDIVDRFGCKQDNMTKMIMHIQSEFHKMISK